jgi:hypothetical protein
MNDVRPESEKKNFFFKEGHRTAQWKFFSMKLMDSLEREEKNIQTLLRGSSVLNITWKLRNGLSSKENRFSTPRKVSISILFILSKECTFLIGASTMATVMKRTSASAMIKQKLRAKRSEPNAISHDLYGIIISKRH